MILAAIVPFLNEERHLGELLASLEAQTRPFDRLLLVDDGSTDASLGIAEAFARRHPEASVQRRPPQAVGRDRLSGAGELLAFQWSVERLEEPWDVVAKLDADIRLAPRTVEMLERALDGDPALGMVGCPLSETGADGVRRRMRSRPEQVHGATSFYRRACWEEISPLPAIVGWDMMDAPRARLRGWRTATVEVPGEDSLHLRPMGGQDGLLRGFRRWGTGAYAVGEHPLHVLLLALRRTRERPLVLGALNYLLGWALAAVRRAPRAEPELRAFMRADQLRRIRARLAGRQTGG